MQNKKSPHFEISERKLLLRVVDVMVACLAIYVVSHFDGLHYFRYKHYPQWFMVIGVYVLFFGTVFEMYDLQKAESKYRVLKSGTITVSLTVLLFLLTPKLTPSLPENRIQILYFYTTLLIFVLIWRFAYIELITAPRFYKRVLVVGETFDIDSIIYELGKKDPNYDVVAYIDTDKNNQNSSNCQRINLNEFQNAIHDLGINEIVVTNSLQGVNAELYQKLVPALKEGFTIKAYTNVYEEITGKIPIENVKNDFYCYFPFSRSNQNRLYLTFSRTVDVLVSLLGICLLPLIIPFILLFNLIGNPGSLFYHQERVGKNGKIFKVIKFRTMIKNAEQNGAQWAVANDKRITKFGNILRRTRLDEIPQFINVLKGEMSFIGPRPERPYFVNELLKTIPFYEIRHVIKPGLTGWAQVNAKYAASEEDTIEKLQYDLYYIKKRNIFLDLRIFLKTMSTILFYRGQ